MRAAVRLEEPLSRHTAWRTGGPCDAWVVAHDEDAVQTVLSECDRVGWSVTVLGSASRVLMRDGGMQGVVLRLGVGFRDLRIVEDCVEVGGAVPVPVLLAKAAEAGLAADRELYLRPGTFGASALHDDWDLVSVRLARASGVRDRPAAKVGSRTKGVVVRGTVRLQPLGANVARARLEEALRRAVEPPGSWFSGGRGRVRNVLRRAALNQVRLRAVAIPDLAPEVLVNLGGGTASDMLLLQKSAIERVKRVRGVTLSPTLKRLGRKPDHGGA